MINDFLKKRFLRYLNIKKTLREMDELNERLLKEKEIRQEFFANASHELKTPITSIRGYAELLESDMIKDEDTKRDMISRIKKEADHMNMLIADILEVSKLESNDIRPEVMRVDVNLLIEDTMETFKPRADEAQVTLYNYSKPGTFVYADYGHMDEIISNLVSNAILYNRDNGKVWIYASNEGGRMELRVRDTGIGIPKSECSRIFERFYRVDKGRSRVTGGTGLGLSIVKHILSYYKGTIEVNSKTGSGSEFIVRIPEHYER